ncbi:MAG TPA: serine/threonine-protein kinase [Streptosporangiaceae bacterium]
MSRPPEPPAVAPREPGDPAEAGGYQLLGRLGTGGMGTVHLGRAADGRLAAVKIIHGELARDDEFRVRFAAEAENARRVASFCTAQVLGQGEVGGRPYMVTEFIDGDTLHQYVARHGPLPPGTLQGVAVGVAAGLAAIHSAGLVHRDLKPANVILSVSGPRVIDFGIARALDVASGATPTGFIVGSPGWIAPEQLLNRPLGTFADIFAWACLICYAGNARHPYGRGDAVTMAARILHADPDLGDLPPSLRTLVTRALSREPTERPTALELMLAVVGGNTQGVERATVQLITTEWPPTPAPSTPHPTAQPTSEATPEPAPAPTPKPGSEVPGPTSEAAPGLAPAPAPEPTPAPAAAPGAAPAPAPEAVLGPTPAHTPPVAESTPPPPVGRRRGWLWGVAGVVVVLVAGGAAYGLWPRSPAATAAFRAVPLGRGHPTDVGRPLHLGPADITVGVPRCGPAAFRGRAAKGRFCLVPLIVYNNGDSGRPRTVRLTPGRLRLLDSGGGQHSPAAVVDGLTPGDTELPDGARTAGDLLFDVPRGADPVSLSLVTTEPHAAPGVTAWV